MTEENYKFDKHYEGVMTELDNLIVAAYNDGYDAAVADTEEARKTIRKVVDALREVKDDLAAEVQRTIDARLATLHTMRDNMVAGAERNGWEEYDQGLYHGIGLAIRELS
jgi:hypothetical protein